MLAREHQIELNFSKYSELYKLVIKDDNKWKRMNDEIDFSFVYDIAY